MQKLIHKRELRRDTPIKNSVEQPLIFVEKGKHTAR